MDKIKRDIIKIDEEKCTGCGKCITGCPEQAIEIVDTPKGKKARLAADIYCDGIGACMGSCPEGAITVIKKGAEPYDERATVERIKKVAPHMLEKHAQYMKEHGRELPDPHSKEGHSPKCPFSKTTKWDGKNEPAPEGQGLAHEVDGQRAVVLSELRQWPVQLALVDPEAPYFRNADLVVAADCVPFAYAGFHRDFIKGKIVVTGCPKLDDTGPYLEKLADIFRNGVKSVVVVNMEVPCCYGLWKLVRDAILKSGRGIPAKQVIIGIKGDIKTK
jgi:NAD-dependent dihydropyrimidine dehydrogenase PreA subunit